MSDHDPPRETDVAAINGRLADGLKSCRSIVANYRLMIACPSNDNLEEESAANDGDEPAPPAPSELG